MIPPTQVFNTIALNPTLIKEAAQHNLRGGRGWRGHSSFRGRGRGGFRGRGRGGFSQDGSEGLSGYSFCIYVVAFEAAELLCVVCARSFKCNTKMWDLRFSIDFMQCQTDYPSTAFHLHLIIKLRNNSHLSRQDSGQGDRKQFECANCVMNFWRKEHYDAHLVQHVNCPATVIR